MYLQRPYPAVDQHTTPSGEVYIVPVGQTLTRSVFDRLALQWNELLAK